MDKSFFLALKSRPFLFLWLSELFGQMAVNMMMFILLLLVYSLTSSSTAVSGVLLAFFIPGIFLAILAGAYVDRRDKKNFLVWTNALRAICIGFMALFHNNVGMIYIFIFATSIVTQFFVPAETPMIPLLVERDALFAANALFGIAFYGSMLIAYALSGPVLIFFGPQNSFILISIFFALGAVFAALIKRPKLKIIRPIFSGIKKSTIITEIKNALGLIVKVKEIYHAFLLLIFYQALVLIISVIGPGYAKNILGIPITSFPILFVTPAAVGMCVAAFILIRYFHNRNRRHVATVGIFLAALAIFLLPYASKLQSKEFVLITNSYLPHFLQINILHIVVVLAFILGLASALIFVPSNTIIQEQTSDEIRGKMYGALNTLISVISFLPVLAVGGFADLFGVASVLYILSACIFAIGIYRILTN